MRIATEIQNISHAEAMMEKLYSKVAFENALSDIDSSQIQRLRQYFACEKSERVSEQIYDEGSAIFFLRYGMSNLIKNYYVLSELYQLGILERTDRILDIGSGPGTFALACTLWMAEHKRRKRIPLNLTMVDGSEESLRLFEIIWRTIPKRNKKHIIIKKIHSPSFGDFPYTEGSIDLIVFSNSLSEMLRDARVDKLRLLNSIVNSRATVLVIDHFYESTKIPLSNFVGKLTSYYRRIAYYGWDRWMQYFDSVDLDDTEFKIGYSLSHDEKITSNVKFLKTILMPKDKDVCGGEPHSAHAVMLYKHAWEKHDTRLLSKLFTNDAIYYEKPGSPPFNGIDQICSYWRENKSKQESVHFTPKFVDYRGNSMRVFWECSFYRIDLKQWMLLSGLFDAKFRRGRICHFKEIFNKKIASEKPF